MPDATHYFISAIDCESRSDAKGDEMALEGILRKLGFGEITQSEYEGPDYGHGVHAYFVVRVPTAQADAFVQAAKRRGYQPRPA